MNKEQLLNMAASETAYLYGKYGKSLKKESPSAARPQVASRSLRPEKDMEKHNKLFVEEMASTLGIDPAVIQNNSDSDEGIIGILNRRSRKKRFKKYQRKLKKGGDLIKIVAEGDSWFEYPLFVKDLIDWLSADKRYAIKSLSAGGDWLANMYGQREYIQNITSEKPSIFLISGGGNDLLGDGRIGRLVEKYSKNRESDPKTFVKEEFDHLLIFIERLYSNLFNELAEKDIQIICHGYDYAYPTDRVGPGVVQSLVHVATGNGQWLNDPLAERDIKQIEVQHSIVKVLINRFNEMLMTLADAFPHVHYIDLRGMAPEPDNWFDEIHPKSAYFKIMAEKFKSKISMLTDLAS
ncbi:MAG: hypothetical protein AAF824_03175 [Bacteroidota bacterium]